MHEVNRRQINGVLSNLQDKLLTQKFVEVDINVYESKGNKKNRIVITSSKRFFHIEIFGFYISIFVLEKLSMFKMFLIKRFIYKSLLNSLSV